MTNYLKHCTFVATVALGYVGLITAFVVAVALVRAIL